MKTGALIAATGASDRGGERQPLLQIGALSVVQRLCMTFHLAGVSPIVVVASKEDQQALGKHLAHMPAVLLTGTGESAEMLAAVKAGLGYLSHTACERILVTPVNVPLFSIGTVKALLATDARLAVPVCEGRRGHPLMIASELIPQILQYQGDNGLRGAIGHSGATLAPVEVNDPGVYLQSAQFDECESIAANHDLSQWRPVMKLRIARESGFFGPGSWQLLSLIQSTGSVRTASEYMGISYSKAWKLLNNLEEQAGYRVIDRQQGGRGGGTSSLTEQGLQLMEWYEQLEMRCNQAVGEIFRNSPPPGYSG